jgi:predicted permease
MGSLWQDIKHSVRTLLKQRGFSLIVVSTLALGIGVNTAVFSVVDAVLFRPLPFAEPGRLVDIWEQEAESRYSLASLRPEQIETWRAQSRVFEGVETYTQRDFIVTGGMEPESLTAGVVSPGLFPMLGVSPQLGRPFSDHDAVIGSGRAVILSDTLWRARFGAAPDVLGKTLLLSDQAYTVVGVMPARFKFPYRISTLWVPLTPAPAGSSSQGERLRAIARLKRGLTPSAAQSALDSLLPALKKDRPDVVWGVKLVSLDTHRVNPRPRQALLVLMGAVGFVLLLACANAANLLLARAAGREAEIAVRLAIGASRRALVRQFLVESVVLALMGGTLGLLLAWVGVGVLARMVPSELTFLTVAKIDMDPRVLLFTFGVTLLTGIAFGLAPAVRTSRPDLQLALSSAASRATADRAHNRLRNTLVVIQVAVSLILLIGAGLMVRTFLRLNNQPPGFEARNLIAADLSLPAHRYQTGELQRAFFDRLKVSIAAMPGVESVTVAGGVPPAGGGMSFDLDIEIEGRPPLPKDKSLILPFNRVDEEYFKVMRIPILRGRPFRDDDRSNPERLLIINEEMSRQLWPNENPIGQRIRFSAAAPWRLVVGVAANVGVGKPGSGFSAMSVYYPSFQETGRMGQRTLLVRTAGGAEPLIPSVKSLIRRVDKDQPILRIDTAETRVAEGLAEPRFYLRLLGTFGLLTLLLVAIGIYGVMAHAVTQRRREIGIRQALGARRNDIVRLVLSRGIALTLAGILVGAIGALSLSRAMAAFLFGSPANDPQTYTLVALLMMAVALAACWIPAMRATRVDPLVALRHE